MAGDYRTVVPFVPFDAMPARDLVDLVDQAHALHIKASVLRAVLQRPEAVASAGALEDWASRLSWRAGDAVRRRLGVDPLEAL